MTDSSIVLPDGTNISGTGPVVIIGPNGSGKTRQSRRIQERTTRPIEFVNALRNTRISQQLPAMSQIQARQNHESGKSNARSQPWEIAADFDYILSQLLAEDGDSARDFREASKTGQNVKDIRPTALEVVATLWSEIFPGRRLEWRDWSPVIHNEHSEVVSYSANQMSDGERAALYLLAKVLLSPSSQIMVIDEPETHFHSQLAVRLWDALERSRDDLRFVYVTHDLVFALSREPATFLLADPRSGLVSVEIDEDLPSEVRREILGAASFSYFASRIVFCEGENQSLDNMLYSAWFKGRDTVVLPVGSCETVRQSVKALNNNRIIENLEAVGLIDRDFQPDAVLSTSDASVFVLPVHEIEGLICMPEIATRIGRHLGKNLDPTDLISDIRGSITSPMINRCAYERMKQRLLNESQDIVLSRPSGWDISSLHQHARAIEGNLIAVTKPEAIFNEELIKMAAIRDQGSIDDIVRTFPSKPIVAIIGNRLGMKTERIFELMTSALLADSKNEALAKLGIDLEENLTRIGFPARTVAERSLTAASA